MIKKYTNKTRESNTRTASEFTDSPKRLGSAYPFADKRPASVAQRKLQDMAGRTPLAGQVAQLRAAAGNSSTQQPILKKKNTTGLPDHLKSGIENLSGYSMDDVKVHRNSDKPHTLGAHAYAEGTNIHVAPGQERYLPHEAWHVVQQKQGRVKATKQLKGGIQLNTDTSLENEADVMGGKAIGATRRIALDHSLLPSSIIQYKVVQLGIDELVQFVVNNDQHGFASHLRGMRPGMDEMFSCETAFKSARAALAKGDMAEVRRICIAADSARLPTQWTGGHYTGSGGTPTQWAHPTSTVASLPTHPWSAPVGAAGTHYRPLGHTTFNRERAAAVMAETGGAEQQMGTAIAFTLAHVPPPFAPEAMVNSSVSDAEKEEFNRQRDEEKKKHPKFDPTQHQPKNAPWIRNQGGVSPLRDRPNQ